MEQVRKEALKRMLCDRKRAALRNSKSGMKQLISGAARASLGAASEDGDLSLVFQDEIMQCTRFSSQWELIRNIDCALKSIDDGTYGICGECNERISEDRLSIVPFALYCRECQEAMETENIPKMRS
jgi:DnaK suppressor protein